MRSFVFTAAGSSYALDAAWIQAVHPLVRARAVPGTPTWLTGVIDVHGELVPMIDAATLLSGTGRPVERTLGARVLLVDTGIGPEGVRARFALAVDRVLDAVELEQDGGWRAGAGAVPWLGAVLQHAGHAVQVLDPLALAGAHPQLAAPVPTAIVEGSR